MILTRTTRLAAVILTLTVAPALAQSNAPATDAATGADPAANSAPAAAAATPAAQDAAATAQSPAYDAQKVVYHINGAGGDDGKGYNGALNNIRNHLDAVGDDNIDLRVVLHGNGIELLQIAAKDQGLQGRISDLKNRGVRFLVCNNTLTGRNIDPASLFDVWKEDIVPSGVAELGKLQGEGFAYIKP